MNDLAELQRARALWATNRLPAALRIFDQVVRQHPRHVLALVDASRAFGSVYQFGRAEALLQRLVELGQDRGDVLHLAGQSYRLIRRPERARECFRRAIELGGPASSDAHLEMALLCERCHELEQASQHVASRLHLKPGDDEGRMVKGQLLHRLGRLEAAEELLRDVAQKRSAHWMTRMRSYAELAAVCDRRAAYDEAWQAMLAAKSIARPHAQAARRHRDRIMRPLSVLAQSVTAAHFDRWRVAALAVSPQPVALLTGLPRSGTTLLELILAAHRQIVTADEWDAFPRLILPTLLGPVPLQGADLQWLDQIPAAQLDRKRRIYFRFLAAALGESLEDRTLVDKNPSLLPLLPVYRRMIPHSQLIVALRDPRDVLLSCLMTHFSLNDFSVDFLSLESAAARVIADLNTWLVLRDQLGGAWVEVRYEDLVRDMRRAVAPVLGCLGLEWQDRMLEYRTQRAARHVHSPAYDTVCQPIYTDSLQRWRHYARQLEPVLDRFNPLLDELGYAP